MNSVHNKLDSPDAGRRNKQDKVLRCHRFWRMTFLCWSFGLAGALPALELSPELENELIRQAEQLGVSPEDMLREWAEQAPEQQNDPGVDALFAMSLESLLKTEIRLPSKRPKSVQHTPGTVTSYSRKELRRVNRFNLADLADITPGYSSYTVFGERVFETRGEKASSFENNKHRVLLDGIPINHARGMKAPSEEELSLFMAEQVDFLRGPASALYGVSAFLGVIDIATIDLDSAGNYWELRSGLGNKQGRRYSQGNAVIRNSQAQGKLFFSHTQQDASRTEVGGRADDLHRNYDDQNSQMLYGVYEIQSGRFEGWSFGNYFSQTRGGLGEFWQGDFSTEANQLEWETWVPFLKYQRQLSEHLSWRTYAYHNSSREAGFIATVNRDGFVNFTGGNLFAEYDIRVDEQALRSELDWQGADGKGLIAGLEYDVLKQSDMGFDSIFINADNSPPIDLSPAVASSRIKNIAAFFQYDDHFATFSNGMDVIAGLRFDRGSNPSNVFTQWSPRLALVQHLDQRWGLKLMMSSALRAPNTKELLLNGSAMGSLDDLGADPGVVADVEAETFETNELAFAYNGEDRYFNLSLYRNKTENSVVLEQEVVGANTINYFANSSQVTRTKGMEVELREVLNKQWLFNTSYAYAKADTGIAGSESIPDIPDQKVKLGFAYQLNEATQINYSGRYVNEFRVAQADGSPGFTRHDLNLQYDLNPTARLIFAVDNLLDSRDYFTFDGNRSVLMDSRELSLSLNVQFH